MKKYAFLFILCCFTVLGCGRREAPVMKINNLEIDADELGQDLKRYRFDSLSEDDKKDVLDQYVDKKLMLLEAERLGLDRDPVFLGEIQRFWEQSLLSILLKKTYQDLSLRIEISGDDLLEYYNQYKDEYFADIPYKEAEPQIQMMILKERQNELLLEWLEELRTRADVTIDFDRLGLSSDNL